MAIYPNPASESTTISLNIEIASNVTIEAIDFTERRVQTILNRKLAEGQYETSWNVNDLPAGIYYVLYESPHRLEKLLQVILY